MAKKPSNTELQTQDIDSIARSLKQLVVIGEKMLSGQVFHNFNAAEAVKEKEVPHDKATN